MADSDGEYVQDVSDNENDMQIDGRSGYGTRTKGKGRASGQVGLGNRSRDGAVKSWEGSGRGQQNGVGLIREDAQGRITGSLEGLQEARKRKRLQRDTNPFQRGIIRHVILVLDLSEAMLEKDMRPNRYIVTLKYAQEYVREFFEQNPISQMSVMGMHDGICIRISELSGNPNDHIAAIQAIRSPRNARDVPKEPKGSPSLQNALEMSRAALYHTPNHGTREVIIVLGALLTLDPGDIHTTIKSCVRDKIRVSIIGMAGRLKICQEICARTNAGDDSVYGVALDQQHFRELLMATTTPPVIRQTAPDAQSSAASLLMMGFPSRVIEDTPSLCACHGNLTRGGYTCSRCRAKVCSLPATCPSCNLTLILSTHLARSYHHLFPLKNWEAVSWARARRSRATQCKGCLSPFPDPPKEKERSKPGDEAMRDDPEAYLERMSGASESSRYECPECKNHFCIDCDVFCHEVVHNCPGCLSGTNPASSSENGTVRGEDYGNADAANGHMERMDTS